MAQTRRVGRTATSVMCTNGRISVVYHSTEVVLATKEKIVLNTGGWTTATTKARMNQASNQFGLGYKVYQKDRAWFVTYKGETRPFEGQELELIRDEVNCGQATHPRDFQWGTTSGRTV